MTSRCFGAVLQDRSCVVIAEDAGVILAEEANLPRG